ncbi:MAG TPA: hypothetical protein VF611_20710 [Pyrinomonadaceae bacterium]
MSRTTPAAVAAVALLLSLAQSATAQNAATATQAATRTPQTQPQPQPATPPAAPADKTQTHVASTPSGETVAAKASPEPLYREYRGVKLGMSASDVRAKLGKPQEKSDVMDFFVFSERERARVYYTAGKASAVIATYIGKDAAAPAPAAVLGSEIEAKSDGSMYRMTMYPQAGYWVAYSRTPGDAPLVMITMQKTP